MQLAAEKGFSKSKACVQPLSLNPHPDGQHTHMSEHETFQLVYNGHSINNSHGNNWAVSEA